MLAMGEIGSAFLRALGFASAMFWEILWARGLAMSLQNARRCRSDNDCSHCCHAGGSYRPGDLE